MKRKILLVDDGETYLRNIGQLLEDKGYEVIKATNAESANKIFDTEDIGLVITDILMDEEPEGFKVLENTQIAEGFPVIGMSANEDYAQEWIKKGGVYFFNKPLDTELLSVVVDRFYNKLLVEMDQVYRQ
ncbi:MAG: response regulator [Nanoarchaeota archaeon]|nr:response regulator [Nanoarchaeota archaeon]